MESQRRHAESGYGGVEFLANQMQVQGDLNAAKQLAKFGMFDKLEYIARGLIAKGYTPAARRDERGPKQYYLEVVQKMAKRHEQRR